MINLWIDNAKNADLGVYEHDFFSGLTNYDETEHKRKCQREKEKTKQRIVTLFGCFNLDTLPF